MQPRTLADRKLPPAPQAAGAVASESVPSSGAHGPAQSDLPAPAASGSLQAPGSPPPLPSKGASPLPSLRASAFERPGQGPAGPAFARDEMVPAGISHRRENEADPFDLAQRSSASTAKRSRMQEPPPLPLEDVLPQMLFGYVAGNDVAAFQREMAQIVEHIERYNLHEGGDPSIVVALNRACLLHQARSPEMVACILNWANDGWLELDTYDENQRVPWYAIMTAVLHTGDLGQAQRIAQTLAELGNIPEPMMLLTYGKRHRFTEMAQYTALMALLMFEPQPDLDDVIASARAVGPRINQAYRPGQPIVLGCGHAELPARDVLTNIAADLKQRGKDPTLTANVADQLEAMQTHLEQKYGEMPCAAHTGGKRADQWIVNIDPSVHPNAIADATDPNFWALIPDGRVPWLFFDGFGGEGTTHGILQQIHPKLTDSGWVATPYVDVIPPGYHVATRAERQELPRGLVDTMVEHDHSKVPSGHLAGSSGDNYIVLRKDAAQ